MLKMNYKKDVIKFGDVFLFSVFYNLIVWLSIVMEKYLLKIFKFDDDLDEDDNNDIFDVYDKDIDHAIFADPTLMVKWLEQQEKQVE